jgi:hypothetical protein
VGQGKLDARYIQETRHGSVKSKLLVHSISKSIHIDIFNSNDLVHNSQAGDVLGVWAREMHYLITR